MQAKHLIVFALAGIVLLLGFNMINGSRHEQNRAVAVNNDLPVQSTDAAVNEPDISSNQSVDVASKPLGEQPKAIIDNATTQIDRAQQVDKERLEQMDSAQ
ncbi:hypothetical protein [Psychrobacter sp. LV10R520-6]|uniref:hypothetical protein n=1 Tax=Psychrobacter sp. LV10R520-6 TaxID=1415574 RepID=UPI0024CAD7B2|nr:hypothetical protein [Psychrobacter sp. LV10R520-6]SNT71006.1 hypothetical protein SAMN04488491_2222 [Psychrobacter sp. LV10R520-6]